MKNTIFVLVVLPIFYLHGQNVPKINLTIEDGLPSNIVYDVFQDAKGYVWVGTEYGLARFNGTTFKTYPSRGLKSFSIANLQEDSTGNIWGVNFYGQIVHLKNDTLQPLADWDALRLSGFPQIMIQDHQVFIVKERLFYQYDISSGTLSQVGKLPATGYMGYFLGDQEVWKFDKYQFERVVSKKSSKPFTFAINEFGVRPEISALWKSYILLTYNKKSIFRIKEDSSVMDVTHLFSSDHRNLRGIKNLNDDLVALIGSDGLLLLDKDLNMFRLLPGENIGSITALNEGGLMVGTLDNGLFMIPSLTSRLFPRHSGQGYYRIERDTKNDRLIVGDLGGNVHFYNSNGDLIYSYSAENKTAEVQSIYADEDRNRLFVQNYDFLEFDLQTMMKIRFHHITTAKKIIRYDSSYYLSSSNGLLRFDFSGQISSISRGLRMTSVESLFNIELLLGTQQGLLIYDLKTASLVDSARYAFQNEVEGLTLSRKFEDQLLLGTGSNGLYVYDNSLEKRHHLTIENGLISNRVNAIDVNEKYIAVGTEKGVSLIDQLSNEIINIDGSKGLQSTEITDIVLGEDLLWLTNQDGLQSLQLPVQRNVEVPFIEIEDILVDGLPVKFADSTYFVPFDLNELNIKLDVANNIQSLGNTRIYYRIAELNKRNWTITSLTNPVATYLSLPSGNYTFEAYALNNDKVKSNILKVPIVVSTPYWRQLWFLVSLYLFGAIIIAGVVYAYFQRINKRERLALKERNRLQMLRIAQLTSIRAQMNPHFIFNTLSSIQGLIMKGATKDAGQSLQDFSKLMRTVLEVSAEESVTLEAELKIISNYLTIEKRRLNDELSYSIDIDPEIIPEHMYIPSLLTQPFVENALRHGLLHKKGNKILQLRFFIEDDFLQIEIEDNGIGRKAASELRKQTGGKSFALEAYNKRIDLLNEGKKAKISLEIVDMLNSNQQPKGTLVRLKIPLDYE